MKPLFGMVVMERTTENLLTSGDNLPKNFPP
jgi:hypothetical protein